MYASTCTSLAAQGYLVAAIEHRDGSASNAAFISADGTVTYQRYLHTDGKFSYRREQLATRQGEFNAVAGPRSTYRFQFGFNLTSAYLRIF